MSTKVDSSQKKKNSTTTIITITLLDDILSCLFDVLLKSLFGIVVTVQSAFRLEMH
jgi:hypothetical protein